MRAVRNTVDTGRTVVCTILQPSIDIFESFDELFLMKQGGVEIYVGTLGKNSCQLIKYFEDIEWVRKIKNGYNHATWMLEVTTQAQEEILGINFAEYYRNSVFYREKAAGMCSALPYACALVLIEIPHIFLQALIYGLKVYSCISFHWTAAKLFWFLIFMYFTFYGMMAVAVTPSCHISAIVSTAFYFVWNVFAGFLIPRPRIPVWWRWYSWACPVAWTLYGLVASQLGDYTNVNANKYLRKCLKEMSLLKIL